MELTVEKRKELEILISFYFLKKKMHEECVEAIKRDILRYSTSRSWREKRNLFEQRKGEMKCLGCQSKGGNIFYESVESKNRVLHSRCGASKVGCGMNMDICIGCSKYLMDCLRDEEANVMNYKKDIIMSKNDLLYGIKNTEEVVGIFQKLKKQLGYTSTSLQSWYSLYRKYIDGKDEQEEGENHQVGMNELNEKMKKKEAVSGKAKEYQEYERDMWVEKKQLVKDILKYRETMKNLSLEKKCKRELNFATDESKLGLQLDKSVIEDLKKGLSLSSSSSSSSSSHSSFSSPSKTLRKQMMIGRNKTIRIK